MRGQYFAGSVDGENRAGYRQEEKVASESNIETYIAAKLHMDNWRWSGVPFYLRTGKNLPLRASAEGDEGIWHPFVHRFAAGLHS